MTENVNVPVEGPVVLTFMSEPRWLTVNGCCVPVVADATVTFAPVGQTKPTPDGVA